jgi:hypothetical protein
VWRPDAGLEDELTWPEKKRQHAFDATRPVRLSAEDFAILWSKLDEIGVFESSSILDGDPPRDVAYLLFEDEASVRILTDPRATPHSSGEALLAWSRAKALIVTGLGETQYQWVRRGEN